MEAVYGVRITFATSQSYLKTHYVKKTAGFLLNLRRQQSGV